MNIDTALNKLNSLLPLLDRQKSLNAEYQIIHRDILNSFIRDGKAPDNIEQSVLNILEKNDLIVLDEEKKQVIGAYPFSLRPTAHHVFNDDINLYAMCAFDAVAIAPVFNARTHIVSRCHVTNEKIEIKQNSDHIIKVKPSEDIYIGIRWQSPGSCAADNLCMEMVFLKDENTAMQWKNGNENFSIFPLNDAVVFAFKYFKPLLGD